MVNYLVVNTRTEDGLVMAMVPFETKEEAEAFIDANANKLKAIEEEQAKEEYEDEDYEFYECIVVHNECSGTTLLENAEDEILCAWDIFPVKDMADTPEKVAALCN